MPLMGLSFLMLLLNQTGTGTAVTFGSACPDKLRVDLSVRTPVRTPEVCISPGQLTGFVFDQPASVDLQEELRFGEVLRGRTGISFVPPAGFSPGERLRLTVHFAQDSPGQGVTFVLVASPGRATHQVDVFHDARSRESLWLEIDEERMKNQQLWAENQSLRRELISSSPLRHALNNGDLTVTGIQARAVPESEHGLLAVIDGVSIRTPRRIAVRLRVTNPGPDPWKMTAAQITAAQGQPVKNFAFDQVRTDLTPLTSTIFIEMSIEEIGSASELTLTLIGEDTQSVTIPHIQLP